TGLLGLLTACWVGAEVDDRMHLNDWSIAASYDTARIVAASALAPPPRAGRSSRARAAPACASAACRYRGSARIDPAFQAARHRRYLGCPPRRFAFRPQPSDRPLPGFIG